MIKICIECNNDFEANSNSQKFCTKCKDEKKLFRCECCKNLFQEKEKKHLHICDSCKSIKHYCECGCGKELPFIRAFHGQKFLKGHARRGRKNSEAHNKALTEGRINFQKNGDYNIWNKGLTKDIDSRVKCSESRKQKISNTAKQNGIGKWMKNKQFLDLTKDKISKRLKGHEVSESTRSKISKKNSGINNGMFSKHHSIETREQISLASAKSLITRPMHSRYKHGQFYSEKNKKYLHYRSSYELLAYQLFESISKIISYEVESIRIEYFDKIKRHYVPDVLVTYDDGQKELIEIKPKSFLNKPRNILKFEAAKKYAESNNLKFSILNEDTLKIANMN